MQPIQKSGSKAFMVRRLSVIRTAGQSRIAIAARSWAYHPPPSSRAMRIVSATSAVPASAGRIRSAANEPPIHSAILAYTAMSGAAST
jgi:hypothetical protein